MTEISNNLPVANNCTKGPHLCVHKVAKNIIGICKKKYYIQHHFRLSVLRHNEDFTYFLKSIKFYARNESGLAT